MLSGRWVATVQFVGRTDELKALEGLYAKDRFQLAVIYGRRRVGKTALISRFCEGKRALMFTAREQSDTENLRDFSQIVYSFFNFPQTTGIFGKWQDALDFVAHQAKLDRTQPFVFVFDEFPYAAQSQKSLPSTLQIAIDHQFADTNVTMILCGSNEGFMESEVLGSKSPLYGRRNAQIQLQPFDLFDAVQLMPGNASWEDRINYYAALGGTPYYLLQLNDGDTYAQNLERLCYTTSGILYSEPEMLMRQELREPAMYNSLLNAIGAGRNTPTLIGDQVGIERTSVSGYLRTLESLGIVERKVPFGQNPSTSKKGLWRFKDPFFAYWYRFVGPTTGLIERGLSRSAATHGTQGGAFTTFVGQQFEEMCMQWIVRQCRAGRMDFLPTEIGKWWGNDPVAREQTDIDIVMADSINERMLLGECKWRNSVNETEAIATLKARADLVKSHYAKRFMLFTKHPVNATLRDQADGDESLMLVDAEHMFFGFLQPAVTFSSR